MRAEPVPPPSTDGRRAAALTFEGVRVVRDGRCVLDSVDAVVPAGAITVLSGPSGSGKTTLLRLCNRLDVPDAGRVLFDGQDVAALDPLRLRRRVGMVFQKPTMLAGSVADNIRLAVPDAGDDRCRAALARAALDESLLDRAATALSGGEAQRVALARTLITEPDALLLDEPTTALDEGPRLAFERTAQRLAEEGVTILWVTHDAEQIRRVAQHVLLLAHGRITPGGEPDGH